MLIGACQNSAPKTTKPKEKLFIDFFVRYLADESQIKAQASFSEGISPDELCNLDGNFKLSELKGKFPFSAQSIKNQARKLGDQSRDQMGCWKDGSHFYVNMQSFLKWLGSHKYK